MYVFFSPRQFVESYAKKSTDAYARAGGIAEEVLSSIRTVTAFGGQKIEVDR